MKKKSAKYLWLALFLSLLPMLVILLPSSLVHTHDGLVHLPRMAAWFKALKDGQFPPRWAGDLNYGYGTPVLIFMYPWSYLLSAIFLSLGFSLAWSFKLVISLSFLCSALFMFIFSRAFFKDEQKAFLTTVLYQFASFRLAEIVTRGALGEVWAYAFLPLAMFGLIKIFAGKKITGFLLSALGSGLLILSHNSISFTFFAVLVLFILVFGKSFFNYLWGFASLGLGLGLSAFYWLPALWERKYTYGDLFMKDLYRQHFPSLKQLFLPNPFNQSFGQVQSVPVQIGVIHLLALVLAVFFLFKKKLDDLEKRTAIFSLILFLIALFFMQPASIPLWQRIGLLRQFQFSWRLLALVVLAASFCGFVLLRKVFTKKKVFWLLILLIVALSIGYWCPPEGFDKINEEDYWHYPLNTTYFGEADTIWAVGPAAEYPEKRVETIEGEGKIVNFQKDFSQQRFTVEAQTEVNILSHTQFFPGWRVYINGQEAQIEFQDQKHRGLITFRLPPGEHQVLLKFTRTKDRLIAEIISLVSFASCLLFFALRRHKILAHLDQR